MFTHLEKHCYGNQFAFQETRMFPNKFKNILVAQTMYPSLPTRFQLENIDLLS